MKKVLLFLQAERRVVIDVVGIDEDALLRAERGGLGRKEKFVRFQAKTPRVVR
jgi:hypothetical protein